MQRPSSILPKHFDMKRIVALLFAGICLISGAFAQNNGYVNHTVKWFEDLNSISAKYGVPVDVIKAVNELTGNELVSRQKLRIPTDPSLWPAAKAEDSVAADDAEQQDDQALEEEIPGYAIPVNQMSLGIVLPFTTGSANNRSNALDFYSGVLLAARELGKEGLNIEIRACDPISCESAMESDIVIGPFRANEFQDLAELMEGRIYVSPLDQKTAALVAGNSNMVQAAASSSDQFEEALEMIGHGNLIVIASRNDKAALDDIKSALDRKSISHKLCYCDVQGGIEGWEQAYKEEGDNIVIIAINNEAVLNNAVRNMGIEESKGNIQCYATSKVTSYETIPIENVHRANMHILYSYFIDYKDEATLDFIHKFRALYNTEPNQFAFQGHDLAYFLVKTYCEYGKAWPALISERPQMDLLQSSFKLKRLDDGGLVNTAGRKVEYQKNFSVELIKQ